MNIKAIKNSKFLNSHAIYSFVKLLSKMPALVLVFLLAFGSPVLVYSQSVDVSGDSLVTDFVEVQDIQAQDEVVDENSIDVVDKILEPQNNILEAQDENSIEKSEEDPESKDQENENQELETDSNIAGHKIDGVSPPEPIKRGDLNVDNINGNLNYSYKIKVPEGRKGLTPDISLNYNSDDKSNSSIFGYGWSISIPYIERLNKKGSDLLYEEQYFTSSISGQLDYIGNNFYVPRVQNEQVLKYENIKGGWVLYLKNGQKYFYGTNQGSRQDDASGDKVFKWMLEKIEDSNGNYVYYSYYKDEGQIYPKEIIYTNSGSYSGSVVNDGVYKISFNLESRSDVFDNYSSTFRVTTNYRVKGIDVFVNNKKQGAYFFSYKQGYNGARSLLSAISENMYDEDGLGKTLDSRFEYKNHEGYIYETSKYKTQKDLFPQKFNNSGLVVGDINGDSYTDVIHAYEWNYYDYSYVRDAYLRNPEKDEFFIDRTYAPSSNITSFTDGAWNQIDRNLRLIDIDGDLKNDMLMTPYNQWGYSAIRKNNTVSGWSDVQLNSENVKKYPQYVGNPWYQMFFQDINNDGLVDVVQDTDYLGFGVYKTRTSINKGGEFEFLEQGYHTGSGKEPFSYTPEFSADNRHFMMDINGDSLPDIIHSFGSIAYCNGCNWNYTNKVFINTGRDWVLDNSYSLPSDFAYYVSTSYSNYNSKIEIADFNNDGLQDILHIGGYLYINKGKSFEPIRSSDDFSSNLGFLVNNCTRCQNPYLLFDYNLDGTPDFIKTYDDINGSKSSIILANSITGQSDVLSKVVLPGGAEYDISYKKSALYIDSNGSILNPKLPINLQTVSQVSSSDGLGNVATTKYEYAGGYYYFKDSYDRKFAGFAKITKINPDETKEISYNSQGNDTDAGSGEYEDHFSKIGKTYRVDNIDQNGNLIKQEFIKWNSSKIDQSSDAYFVYQAQSINRIFNGYSSYDTAVSNTYNHSNGNLEKNIDYGVVSVNSYQDFTDTGSDKRITEYQYASCDFCTNFYLPSSVIKKDYSDNLVSKKVIHYDNQDFGVLLFGNNTNEFSYIDEYKYSETKRQYNNLGLVERIIDPMGNSSFIVYDQYNLFPVITANSLNHQTIYEYNYLVGKPKKTINPNGTIIEIDYNGFGRPLVERISSDHSYTSLITKNTYIYNDAMNGASLPYIKKIINYSNMVSGEEYTLFDGLGRQVRQLNSSSPPSYYSTDTFYDLMGRVSRKSLPYVYSSSPVNYYGTTSDLNLFTHFTYDSLGRVIKKENSLGSINTKYELNKIIITDQEGKSKEFTYNAFGNLEKVIENNGPDKYETRYDWDSLGNLTKVTDALGNIRNIKYDYLGKRNYLEDLHAPDDYDYGYYKYEYDRNGNLIKKITPNGDTVEYIYDSLNRVTLEELNSIAQINYRYDSCPGGIGNICRIQRIGSSIKNFAYNPRGLVVGESILVTGNNVNFNTDFIYDYQNNITEVVYPDSSRVRYLYNLSGLVERVDRKDGAISPWQGVIDSVAYNQIGQKESVRYSNGRTQFYQYDNAKQFQLNKITVDAPTGYKNINFIETIFNWSPTGNLLSKTENEDPVNQRLYKYHYDDLSRLTRYEQSSPGYIEEYSYNALGNILNKTNVGQYHYNGNFAGSYANPHATTMIDNTNYEYDKNGNLVKIGEMPSVINLKYSYRNELLEYQKIGPGPISSFYLYDENGSRIKTTNSTGTTYIPNKYYELIGNKKTKNIYLGDQLVATIEKVGIQNPSTYYVHPDYLGGTQVITDSSGGIKVQEISYYPFGSIQSNVVSANFDQGYKYTGHKYDKDTDLNYMKARYQSGREGRFWSQDPVFLALGDVSLVKSMTGMKLENILMDPQSINSYVYSRNNPVKNIDPDGKWFKEVLSGQQSLNDFTLELGNVTNYMGSGWQTAIDHPIAAGAVVGVASGAVALGASYLSGAGLVIDSLATGQLISTEGVKAIQARNIIQSNLQNTKVENIIKDLFRPQDKIGGGTIEALKREVATGQLTGGKSHIVKSEQFINRISNIQNSQSLNKAENNGLQIISNTLQKLIGNAKK